MNQIFRKSSLLALAGLTSAAIMIACGDDSTGPSTPANIAATVTPPATAQVATAVPGPAVTVTDAGGNPVAGVPVNFEVTSGGGAIQYSVATTDAQGVASAGLWQVGPKVGTNTVTANVDGAQPLTFTLTSAAGPASAISPQAGNGQSGAPGSTLPTPLTARVVDAGGNAKSGENVTFAVTQGGGSLSSTTATTNASGDATSGAWTLGSGQCVQRVSATDGPLTAGFTASSRSSIAVGGTATGTLSSSDCVIGGAFADEYDLTTPSGAITASMTSTAPGATLQIVTADGSALVAQDVNAAATFRLITAASSKAVRATAAAGGTGAYTVSVASASSAVTDCSPVYLEIGASTDQNLSTTDCTTNFNPPSGDWSKSDVAGDAYLVFIPAGTSVRISETAIPLDALIAFYSPTGSLITYRDNGGVGASGTEVINFTATTSGFYKVVAGSYCLLFEDPYQAGCDYGPYTLSVIKP
jgi:hypothetical protein